VIDVADGKSIDNSFPLKHAVEQADVQFFPEGGDLISGVKSRVAFKAIKPDGLGIDIKGTITDNSGTVVTELTSQHLGMGVFALQPEGEKSYKANITFPDGSQRTFDLPKAQSEGITLGVYNTDPDNLNVKLSANPSFFQKNQNKLFYIVAQNGQTICFAAQTALQSNIYSATIPKSKFPSGVLKLTLFTDHGEPLAERIVFIQRNDILNVTLKTAQATYAPRQKVNVNVLAQNSGQPSEANLSVTVLDETKVPFDENSERTILTDLLLTSDIKGYIEKPNYYFSHADEKTVADMDVLMLTQGYRRFSYKDILADKYPVSKFLPEQGLEITGTIRNNTGLPISKGNLNLILPNRNTPLTTVANMSGEFKFSNLILPDSTKITINAKNNVNSNYLMIILDNNLFQPATPNINAPDAITNIDSTLNSYLKNSKQQYTNSHVLKEVVIRSTTIEKKPSHQDYPALTGLSMMPDHVISANQLSACPFLYQCLQTMAFGLTFDNNNLYITRDYNAGNKTTPVQVYFNGLAVDFNYLQSVNTSDVESVEVFLDDGMSGINKMNNTKGVIVINSKVVKHVQMSKEDIKALLMPQNSAVNIILRGYTQARVFYSPKYDPSKTAPSLGSDLRSTIYWNPKIITDKNGAASFEFYNADAKGSYRAIIEGIDRNGNIGRYIYHYKVQ
ncbi:MAG: carboxypeptidase regulatory-like protein, partial [Mucilaginibacter sp.]|nr:carboxypeptidase regulatory-like protein [Mucilaginibacter sp.]